MVKQLCSCKPFAACHELLLPMSTIFDDFDRYEHVEHETRQKFITRQQRRKPKPKKATQWTKDDTLAEIADRLKLENAFDFTYVPSEHEAGWVLEALQSFLREELITDVITMVKGGKEANVYQCRAHESVGRDFLAAKVYRPKMFRQLRNDAMYKEGRAILGDEGETVTARNKREMRAIKHKSSFGDFLAHQSWLQHEYQTLTLLYDAGLPVPKPYAIANNAILMGFVGDQHGAAPPLHNVNLKKLLHKSKIAELFDTTLWTIETMLRLNRIHGDLSAFNILFWEDDITFIDFPQVTTASKNRNGQMIFQRDVERVCDYFARQGLRINGQRLARQLWDEYVSLSEKDRLADESRFVQESTDED